MSSQHILLSNKRNDGNGKKSLLACIAVQNQALNLSYLTCILGRPLVQSVASTQNVGGVECHNELDAGSSVLAVVVLPI